MTKDLTNVNPLEKQMYTEAMHEKQRKWAEEGLMLMRGMLPLMKPFACSALLEEDERIKLGTLLTAAARSTESGFLLMAYGQLWDAEVVIRSVFEASLKFAFIIQSRQDIKTRLREFTEDMFEIALMKDDQKARDFISVVENPDAPEWQALRDVILSEAYRTELRARYDKTKRRAMETRWGYAGLLEALSRSGDETYKNLTGLTHGYAMASHIHHADYVGVSIALERDRRSPERRDSIHMAHLARLISDSFTCFTIRIFAAYRFAECERQPAIDANSKIKKFTDTMKAAQDLWLKTEYGFQFPNN